MSDAATTYDQAEFERESERLASLVWDAMGISSGDRVLFCGYGPDIAIVRRAAAEGAQITVIESRDELMKRYEDLGVTVLRGSTSAIPARGNSFEVAVANSYLHEIDPLFHANVIQELGRVAARVVIVEPMPPSDAIGKRIATLYSRAKRELGQFEYYQAPSYWRKLLSMSKPQIAEAVFAFTKTPPHEYLVDTLKLLLDTMKVEQTPQYYIDQLHELAAKPGAQMLPQGRLVLIGVAEKDGALPAKSMAALLAVGHAGPAKPAPTPEPPPPVTPVVPQETAPPIVQPVSGTAPEPEMGETFAPSAERAETSFGLPEEEAQPFGAPGIDQPPLGWHWEPPEESGPI
ncbi:hypothetical protein EPN44_10300 [bacterium]|nr:MAG: hypothetical protein EPN44_10300 [bacterium]